MTERVIISGMGAISALGNDVPNMMRRVRAGDCGITGLHGLPVERLRYPIGAQVKGFEPERYFSSSEMAVCDRVALFALRAAGEALEDAGLAEQGLSRGFAVLMGTAVGGKQSDDASYLRLYGEGDERVHPLAIPRIMLSSAPSQISMKYGFTGPVYSISSACASAGHAIGDALRMVREGRAEVVLAGGTEAPFAYGLLKGWEAMRVLSPDTCRPFSRDRRGLVLGEGAAVLVVESLSHARRRGARIHGELLGYGASADAGHITQPSAEGAATAIRQALRDAGLEASEVGYINAHGTGTQLNDITETRAIRLALGDRVAEQLAVSSSKSMLGHTLGASGALELVVTLKALSEGWLPPTANFTAPGDGCNLDYVPNRARQADIAVALSNSFGFGGLNAVLAVRRWPS